MEKEIKENKEKKKVLCKICKNEFKNYYFMNKHKIMCINNQKNKDIDKNKYFIQEGNKYIYYLKKLKKNNIELNEVIVSKEGYIVPDDDSYPQNDDEELLYKLLKKYFDEQNVNNSHDRIIQSIQKNFDNENLDIPIENKEILFVEIKNYSRDTYYDKAYYDFINDPFVFAFNVYLYDKEFNKDEVNPYIKHLLVNILYSKYRDCKDSTYINYYELKDVISMIYKKECIKLFEDKEVQKMIEFNLSTIIFEIRFIDHFFSKFFEYLQIKYT